MEQFDVIVIGSDIASLISALFLARKMRNVLVLKEDRYTDESTESISLIDPENNKYHFKYTRENILHGYSENSLLQKYLDTIGMDKELTLESMPKEQVVLDPETIRERIHTFDQFRVYLVRYYPKQRDQIHRFFKDLERHYNNFVSQYFGMLKYTDYTLTSLMIEWGDYSLQNLLEKYFQNQDLIQEFILNSQVGGFDPKDINSYHFFMAFFCGLKDGFHLLHQSHSEIRNLLLGKLQIINPKMLQNTKIKSYIVDETRKMSKVIDSEGNEYSAKHFIVSQNPKAFYEKHFKDDVVNSTLEKYYPNLDTNKRICTLYLGLNAKASTLGITELVYYFKNDLSSSKRLIRLFNYKLHDKEASLHSKGAICIDFCYDEGDSFLEEEILKRLFEVFPKLKKSISTMKFGKSLPYYTMLSEESVRKNLSINDQILIESGENIQLFDNLYLSGRWMRPEAKLFGLIHDGIVLGDKIEEKLYYGEDDDTFYYLTNDEIMMMIRHNFGKKTIRDEETHVNFHIGKSDYFVRTKKKNITIHHGEYYHPDFSIYSTNDKLSNLLLKKVTFGEVLKAGGLKYQGNTALLYDVVNAFGLDDYQESDPYDIVETKVKNPGMKFLFAYVFIYALMAFLFNYINLIWLAPFAFVLSLGVSFWKYKVLGRPVWFEYFDVGLLFVYVILSIVWPAFNRVHVDDWILLPMGLAFLVAWIINRPIVYLFRQYDYRSDYSSSLLFKVISNGLTFMWALVFLGILGMTYVTGERYVSVLYNLVFFGIFLSYYYPILYVKTNIKK